MRSMRLLLAACAAACLWSGPGAAADTACPEHFWHGSAPVLTNPKLAPQTRELCYSGYAVLHSGLTRTPLWSAEHLTRDRVAAARDLSRVNAFHPDPNLPSDERSELSDYARSGFDRGHMAPSGDMSTPEAMEESFSLANMVPQNSSNNRHLWERIERTVRNLAAQRGELYVVTGPIFQGTTVQSLKGRVLVPSQLFKAVYDPRSNTAGAYLVNNQEGDDYRVISLDELRRLAGIDVFPGLPEAVRQAAADLPAPGQAARRLPAEPVGPPPEPPQGQAVVPDRTDEDFVKGILDAIDRMGPRR